MTVFRYFLPLFYRVLALCVVPVLSVLFLLAPSSGCAAVPAQEQIVSVRYHMLSFGPAIQDLSLPEAMGGRSKNLMVSNLSPGAPLNYRGPRLMRFYQGNVTLPDVTTIPAEGVPPPPPPFAEVLLPANTPTVLLLFIPNGDGGGTGVTALPFNDQQFSGSGFLFQNFTQEPIAVNIGKQKTLVLRPMASDIYQHTGGNSREEGMVRMARLSGEGTPELFYSSRWTHIPGRRTWVFFLPGKTEDKIDVRRFYDVAPR